MGCPGAAPGRKATVSFEGLKEGGPKNHTATCRPASMTMWAGCIKRKELEIKAS